MTDALGRFSPKTGKEINIRFSKQMGNFKYLRHKTMVKISNG